MALIILEYGKLDWFFAVEDIIEVAKSRPILTALIAIETGSWVVRSIKRFIKNRIQSNTVLEFELQGDYTKEGSGDPTSDLLNQSDEITLNKVFVTIYHGEHDSHVRCIFIRMDAPFTMGTAQYEEFRRTVYYFKMYNCGKKGSLTKKIIVYAYGFGSYGTNALGKYYIATFADKTYKLVPFKKVIFNIPNKSTFSADNMIDTIILQYSDNHVSWFNRCNGSKTIDKIYLRCQNINVKIQIKIKIKENSGKEKFCARIEIAFFNLVFKAIPHTRLIVYILLAFIINNCCQKYGMR